MEFCCNLIFSYETLAVLVHLILKEESSEMLNFYYRIDTGFYLSCQNLLLEFIRAVKWKTTLAASLIFLTFHFWYFRD